MDLKDAYFTMFCVYILLTISPLQACELRECKKRKKYVRFSTFISYIQFLVNERRLVCILLDYFNPLSSVSSIFRLPTYLTVFKQGSELLEASF